MRPVWWGRAARRELQDLRAEVERLRALVEPSRSGTGDGVERAASSSVHPTAKLVGTDGRTIRIGERTRILRHAEILGPVTIGDGCFVNRDCYIRPNVTVGDGCSIGPFVRLVTDTHRLGPAEHRAGPGSYPPIVVGDGVWIGASVTILGGVTVGSGAVVAAGAVVRHDVPPNTLVGGVPAGVIRSLEQPDGPGAS
jgi:acetyltransferase-like isoleucine patch superfamily enzyme